MLLPKSSHAYGPRHDQHAGKRQHHGQKCAVTAVTAADQIGGRNLHRHRTRLNPALRRDTVGSRALHHVEVHSLRAAVTSARACIVPLPSCGKLIETISQPLQRIPDLNSGSTLRHAPVFTCPFTKLLRGQVRQAGPRSRWKHSTTDHLGRFGNFTRCGVPTLHCRTQRSIVRLTSRSCRTRPLARAIWPDSLHPD
jgi:hypothetical protein